MRTADEIAAEIEGLCARKRRDDRSVEDYGSAVDVDLKFSDAAARLLPEAAAALRARPTARPLDDWDEECGVALWWWFPVVEPPYCGTPLDYNWPGYHTHWTPLPPIPEAPNA